MGNCSAACRSSLPATQERERRKELTYSHLGGRVNKGSWGWHWLIAIGCLAPAPLEQKKSFHPSPIIVAGPTPLIYVISMLRCTPCMQNSDDCACRGFRPPQVLRKELTKWGNRVCRKTSGLITAVSYIRNINNARLASRTEIDCLLPPEPSFTRGKVRNQVERPTSPGPTILWAAHS